MDQMDRKGIRFRLVQSRLKRPCLQVGTNLVREHLAEGPAASVDLDRGGDAANGQPGIHTDNLLVARSEPPVATGIKWRDRHDPMRCKIGRNLWTAPHGEIGRCPTNDATDLPNPQGARPEDGSGPIRRATSNPDAYAGFNGLCAADRRPMPVVEAQCWAHARRKLFELADIAANVRRGDKAAPISPLALEAVKRIDAVFDAKCAINGLAADERLAVR